MLKEHKAEKRHINTLRSYPKQSVFGDIPDNELDGLAQDIAKRGLDHPVHILTDGTIIQGHQRVRAAKLLGWSEIDVIVRSDLVGKAQLTYETFISDNLRRRHLSPLAKARCIQCLLESANQSEDAMHQLVRDYVGKQLNLSGRSVQRYMQVLRLPAELQDAFDRSEIGLPQVATFFNLTLEERERIAEVARKGGDLSDAFDEARKEILRNRPARSSRSKFAGAVDQWHTKLRLEITKPGFCLTPGLRRSVQQLSGALLEVLRQSKPANEARKARSQRRIAT